MSDVLTIYGEEHAPTVAAPERQGYAIEALLPFWGDHKVSAIKGETCRLYARQRGVSVATIRRELNTLQAALNYCHREGYLTAAPAVTKPPAEETPQRAMTRSEVARLLWAAHRRGQRHLMRFIVLSVYTGTRKSAALSIRMSGPSAVGGWFDLERGILYRRGEGERVTKKRRTPAPIPRQLAGHARRWERMGLTWAIEHRGARVADIKTAWAKVVTEADLGWRPSPHTLKHTAVTWAIERGVRVEDAAAYFSTSAETIRRVYWHLSPHYMRGAVAAIEGSKWGISGDRK